MKNYHINMPLFLSMLPIVALSAAALLGRDWSAEQREVWKSEEAYWAHRAQGDVDAYSALLHSDFVGWPSWAAMPIDKAAGRKFIEQEIKSTKILFYDIRPTAIRVFGNVAVVYYYISMVRKGEGREQTSASRYTHVWMKQGNNWLLMGGDSRPVS